MLCYYMVMIFGIDEVGRGCWAGPLVVGVVGLHDDIQGLNDSKKLSTKQREAFSTLITRTATHSLGWVSPHEIDQLGLTQSVGLAIRRALEVIDIPRSSEIVIDGNVNFLKEWPNVRTVINADATIPSVSAASIIAKVARDAYMKEQAVVHPGYGFERHVGYGTKMHRAALAELGVSVLHRRSYRPVQAFAEAKG